VRYSLLPIALVVGGITALVLIEPDYGTALSIAAVAGLMVFAAGLNFKYLIYSVMALLPLSIWLLVMEPYRVKRITSFLCPECDPIGAGFQLLQSLIAVGTGGVGGVGLMAGKQKLFYLPEPQTDFILAVIGEELGLIGTTVTLIAFILITWRGLQIASRAPDRFGSFLALGLTGMFAVQAFINMSMVLGMMPTKGIPLPFVSFGGSSLLMNLVGMGILLNVSQHASAVHEA
jgi:cell division protein FtsW